MATKVNFPRGFVKMNIMVSSFSFHPWEYSIYNLIHLSGCSHVVYPRGPIQVKMDVVGSIDAKKVVSFTDGVQDARLTLVATQGSHKYFVDYKQWTGFIVSQLEDELRKRGVEVKPESE